MLVDDDVEETVGFEVVTAELGIIVVVALGLRDVALMVGAVDFGLLGVEEG